MLKKPVSPNRAGDAFAAWIATLWLGLLLGVSFLATPVKFHAASLTLPVALEVGRVTFALFCKVEWGLAATLLLTAVCSRSRWGGLWVSLILLVPILVMESCWLLPILDERVGQILAGATIGKAYHHEVYIAAEALKALILLALSACALWRLGKPPQAQSLSRP